MEESEGEVKQMDSEKKSSEDVKTTKAIIILTFFSALGGFLFGYDTGVISGAMLLIREEFELNTLWQEMIVSVTVMAAWLSSLIGGPAADYFGRRKVILSSSLIFVAGAVILGTAPNKEALLVGRVVVGLGIGASSMCVPIYISEVAPVNSRGRLTVINSVFLTGGQFVASIICGIFSGVHEGWRWILGLGAVPAGVQFAAFIFASESPRWLLLNGREEETRTVLKKYRAPNSDIQEEIEQLKNSKEELVSLRAIITSPPVRRALIVGCLLQFFQQIAGINTVMYYSASIISMAGINDDQTAIWMTALTSFFNFSFTFVGLFLVERVGRRPLTLWSILGATLSLLMLAITFHIVYIDGPETTYQTLDRDCSQYRDCSGCTMDSDCGFCFSGTTKNIFNSTCLKANHSQYNEISTTGMCLNAEESDDILFAFDWCPSNIGWLSVLGLCLYLSCFGSGMGPMPWCMNSEIYPNWARARCNSIATSINWATNLFVSLTFLSLTEAITKHGTFYLYTGFAFCGLVTFFLVLPETRGVKLEEVETIFDRPLCLSTPWKKRENREELISHQDSYGTL